MLISQLERLQFGAKVVLWPELGGPITFFYTFLWCLDIYCTMRRTGTEKSLPLLYMCIEAYEDCTFTIIAF